MEDLKFIEFDIDKEWDRMSAAYALMGGDLLYPGDEKEMLLKAALAYAALLATDADNAMRMHTLDGAIGDYLDKVHGTRERCERLAAVPAAARIRVTASVATELPEGQAFTADGEMFYAIAETASIPAGETILDVLATDAGAKGNALAQGTEMIPSPANSAITSVVAETDASGGRDREPDDTYRERIRTYGLAAVTTGPKHQYEAAAMAAHHAIRDAQATRGEPGRVVVRLIVDGDEEEAKAAVIAALSPRDVRPLGDDVEVSVASEVPYAITLEYECDGSSTAKADIEAAATQWRAWQEGKIGRAFNPERLAALAYQAGATRVIWGEGSSFRGSGTIAYTEIGEGEYCKGTVTARQKGI